MRLVVTACLIQHFGTLKKKDQLAAIKLVIPLAIDKQHLAAGLYDIAIYR